MSVADKITQLINDISSSYQKIESKGGTIPTNKNTNNLPDAIDSIPSGGGEAVIEPIEITENGTYTAPEGVDGYSPIIVNVNADAWFASFFDNTISGEVTIPSSINSFGNYTYAYSPFNGKNNITVLTVPNTVIKMTGWDGRYGSSLVRYNAHFRGNFPSDMLIRHNNLKTVVMYEDTDASITPTYFIESCINLDTIIIRRNTFIQSTDSRMLYGDTKMDSGEGRIYVLPDLVETYKTATNWLAYSTQIFPLYIAKTLAQKTEYLEDTSIIDGAMIMCDEDDSLTVKGE